MGKKHKTAGNLGRSLIRDRFGAGNRRTVDSSNSMLHTTELQDGYDWGRLNLQSVTEESSFQEFLRIAEMAGTEFQAEKLNISFVNPKSGVGLLSDSEREEKNRKQDEKKDLLKIPRRPKWTAETTAEELQQQENTSFVEWRRGLAMLQEKEDLMLTPYEKNLEFWRQLWRVVERSDVIVQIVDARNPLLFRSDDLERYVKEVSLDKQNLILANKADFLTAAQRQIWAKHCRQINVTVAFFSATLAEEALKTVVEEKNESDSEDDDDDDDEENDDDDDDDAEDEDEEADEELKEAKEFKQKLIEEARCISEQLRINEQKLSEIEKGISAMQAGEDEMSKLLTRAELIELFKKIHVGPKVTAGRTTIGLVGYPNVGKSSTINALMTEKKVSVSATPGKTKHFQTLFLDTDLLLCDCPGLVMPSFVLTKADMILNGILPIDKMKDHVPAVNQLCVCIPRQVLEHTYGIMIARPQEGEDPDRPPYSDELLLAYGYNRGFMTANGQPDQARAARYVLKDYVNGKLLYSHAPPSVVQSEFHTFPDNLRQFDPDRQLPPQQRRAMRIIDRSSGELDRQFFEHSTNTAYVKGRSDFPHIRTSASGSAASSVNSSMQSLNAPKPWKKQKREKREKLRKKFAHLDQH